MFIDQPYNKHHSEFELERLDTESNEGFIIKIISQQIDSYVILYR